MFYDFRFLAQNTALHLAAIKCKPNAASILLSLNCKIKKNFTECTAIDYALHMKSCEVMHALVLHPTRSVEIMVIFFSASFLFFHLLTILISRPELSGQEVWLPDRGTDRYNARGDERHPGHRHCDIVRPIGGQQKFLCEFG